MLRYRHDGQEDTEMKYNIEFPNGNRYRPETLVINGTRYSATLFAKQHGYNWRTSASGNILCYMSKSGRVLSFAQKYLLQL